VGRVGFKGAPPAEALCLRVVDVPPSKVDSVLVGIES
ncbi:MAG: hypothetical protein ACJAWF_001439, partial [Candidatus Azotimanducaceae bacterium]